uniref:Uncharacterized protein n=1 Tax=Romanomermis culicivorax TaxID=13658 RepID=A0A915KSX2_ROMCU
MEKLKLGGVDVLAHGLFGPPFRSDEPTSVDIDSQQTSDEVYINEKRKDFLCKLLILSNSADSLSKNQIDKYESMLDGIENRQNQLRSEQSCTVARVIPNKDLEASSTSFFN